MVAVKKHAVIDTTGWLTRNQAMDLLGVSMTSLYRWEREGRLHPGTGQREGSVRMIAVYDPTELARLPRKLRTDRVSESEGEITARVFEMFEDGRSIREIVLQTRQTVPKIENLHETWLDAGGAELVISKTAKTELERFVGKFSTVGELVGLITDHLGMPITGTPIGEAIMRGQGEAPEALKAIDVAITTNASDAEIDRGINLALDAAGAP